MGGITLVVLLFVLFLLSSLNRFVCKDSFENNSFFRAFGKYQHSRFERQLTNSRYFSFKKLH